MRRKRLLDGYTQLDSALRLPGGNLSPRALGHRNHARGDNDIIIDRVNAERVVAHVVPTGVSDHRAKRHARLVSKGRRLRNIDHESNGRCTAVVIHVVHHVVSGELVDV